jgi:Putative metallopeptidase
MMALACLLSSGPAVCEPQSGRIAIAYGEAGTPSQASLLDSLKQHRALEKLQEIFSPLKLPSDLTLRTVDCKGSINAWYYRGSVIVCYEYLEQIHNHLPEIEKGSIARTDAIIGQFFYVFAHEMGHAVFDLLSVPVFGRREDAADQFAAFVMLQFQKSEARRLVIGAAHAYDEVLRNPTVTEPLKAYSDAHSLPAQRFYNLMCVAYGSDPQLFADVVDKGYLPKSRAANCRLEYGEVAYAFSKLVSPYIDKPSAQSVLQKSWLPEDVRKPPHQ